MVSKNGGVGVHNMYQVFVYLNVVFIPWKSLVFQFESVGL